MLDSLDYLIIYLSEDKTQTSIIKSFSEFQNEDLTKVLLFWVFLMYQITVQTHNQLFYLLGTQA